LGLIFRLLSFEVFHRLSVISGAWQRGGIYDFIVETFLIERLFSI